MPTYLSLRQARVLGIILIALLFMSCKNAQTINNPQFQPEIVNKTDNFQFQVTGITLISQTVQYVWSNSGTQGSINHSSSITFGTATLKIRDAQGNEVYSDYLKASGTVSTNSGGTPGNWTIIVILSSASGTLNFRVQKM